MPKLDVKNISGTSVGSIDLDDTAPNIAPIKDLCLVSLHLDDDQRM